MPLPGPMAITTLHRPESPLATAFRPSPNHGERVAGQRPDCMVLHYTGMASKASAIDWLCDPASQVSCHYVVDEGGAVLQLVPEERRAWHAGLSYWRGRTDLNSASIGVEIVNTGHEGGLPSYPDMQIEAVIALCLDVAGRHHIPRDAILAHSDIAPGRKRDPGERFPWKRLHDRGLGLWVPPRPWRDGPALRPGDAGEGVADFQSALRLHGYGLERTGIFDVATEKVVRAFQLHFRPERVDGVADGGTLDTLAALSATYPTTADPLGAA